MHKFKSEISIKKSIEISAIAASFAVLGYFCAQRTLDFTKNFNTVNNEHAMLIRKIDRRIERESNKQLILIVTSSHPQAVWASFAFMQSLHPAKDVFYRFSVLRGPPPVEVLHSLPERIFPHILR